MRYTVYVGNVGKVYDGSNERQARSIFADYKSQSKTNYGRVAGETVALFEGDEIKLEYVPAVTRDTIS